MRRVIRTPGTIADDDELDRVRRFLLGERRHRGNAFDAGLAPSLRRRDDDARDEPFALLHQLEESALMPPRASEAAGERRHRADVPAGPRRLLSLAFPREGGGEPYYVLIDCGYKPGSQAFSTTASRSATIVEHLHASSGGHLDLVILTHEHQDHLNGIWKNAKPYFESFEIDEAWLAWTEDPENDLANELRKRHKDQLLGLLAARREAGARRRRGRSPRHARSTRSSASSWAATEKPVTGRACLPPPRTPRSRSTSRG